MIRDSFKAFLVGISLSFTSVFFAQQKITVLDETSGFPIHDVQVIIEYSGSNVMDPIRQEKSTIDRAGLEQYFTNKKGRFSTDLFNNESYSDFGIVFLHENYILVKCDFTALEKADFKMYLISNANTLDETVVSANRISEKKRDVIQKIRVIKSEEIKNQNQSSMADLIGATGNVFVQ